jgi:hypothetical protein
MNDSKSEVSPASLGAGMARVEMTLVDQIDLRPRKIRT